MASRAVDLEAGAKEWDSLVGLEKERAVRAVGAMVEVEEVEEVAVAETAVVVETAATAAVQKAKVAKKVAVLTGTACWVWAVMLESKVCSTAVGRETGNTEAVIVVVPMVVIVVVSTAVIGVVSTAVIGVV